MYNVLRSKLALILVDLLIITATLAIPPGSPMVHASAQASRSGTWTTTGSMHVARRGPTATLLHTGQVLVAGGLGGLGSSGVLASAELYDPSSGTWTTTGSMHTARESHTATLLPTGQVLVVGGDNESGVLASAELYDPSSGMWTTTGSMHTARESHTATLLPTGQVLVVGGYGSGGFLASAELYDPSSRTWTTTGSMHTARYGHTATLLRTGQVLVTGGLGISGYVASAELYDPSSGMWTTTGSMHTARYLYTATLLRTGQVLIAGGLGTSGWLASAELYNPSSGTWTTTGSMHEGRYGHTANLLQSGWVLVSGGDRTGNDLASAELYNPGSGTWTTTGSLHEGRYLPAATLLRTGQVLVAGGQGTGYIVLASAELYSLDTTAPTLRLPSMIRVDATSPQGATVSYTVTVSDPDDAANQLTITCMPASGSTFSIGTTTVKCTASDPAGNSTEGSFHVVVKGAATQVTSLIKVVDHFHINKGLKTSLHQQLQAALNDINAGKTAQARQHLTAFIHHVQAQSGKKLTRNQADQLLTAANRIMGVLGGTQRKL